jgi:hypothetical protein
VSNVQDESDGKFDGGIDDDRSIPLSRYDFVLAAIPLAFLLSVAGSLVASVPLRNALLVGAAVGGLVLADALFGHPPTGNGRV